MFSVWRSVETILADACNLGSGSSPLLYPAITA
jgi:hypothetical protein